MKQKNLFFLIVAIIVVCVGVFFYHDYNTKKTIEHEFRLKESCMKYFDKYRNYLTELYVLDTEKHSQHISDYEMFYNKELNTCISAYSLFGMIRYDGQKYPTYSYSIVDLLNGEKSLFWCNTNTYLETLNGGETDGGVRCGNNFKSELYKYKK